MTDVKRIVGEFLGLLEGLGDEVTIRVDTARDYFVVVADGRRFEGADLAQLVFTATAGVEKSDDRQQELWQRSGTGAIPTGMCG